MSSFKIRCGDRVMKSVENKLAVARMCLPCSRVIMQYATNRCCFIFLKPTLKNWAIENLTAGTQFCIRIGSKVEYNYS